MMTQRGLRTTVAVAAAAGLALAACGSSSKSSSPTSTGSTASSTTVAGANNGTPLRASAPGVSTSTIKIGLIYEATGAAASEAVDMNKAVLARFAAQNAAGGVDGRQLQLVVEDDQSSTTQNLTAAKVLVGNGAFGVIEQSAFAFGAYQYLQKAGVPVVGGGYDGPEWGLKPDYNMFSFAADTDPGDPQYTQPAELMKQNGVTTVAAFGYGESPSSSDGAKGFAFAAKSIGLKVGDLDTSLPFGTVSVGPLALAVKQAGVNGIYLPLDANTNFAIATAVKQIGADVKFVESATGYGYELLADKAALGPAQGLYFPPVATPVELRTPATVAMQAAFRQYEGFTGVPDFSWYEGWLSADLMIKGLQEAGRNPTRQSFINGLRTVTSYNANGLLPSPINFSLADFGKASQTLCGYYPKLVGDQFVVSSPTPVCGTLIPNSNQATTP